MREKTHKQLAHEYTGIRYVGPELYHYQPYVKIGVQKFDIGPGVMSKEDARWYCRMMAKALKRLIELEKGGEG